jgi:hypothetical protein
MATLQGKHKVEEIDGVRCTVCAKGVTAARKDFLTDLLVSAGFEVKSAHEVTKEGTVCDTYILGVTDLLFNPVIRVYQQKLFRKDGHIVTPAFWEQKSAHLDIPYWQVPR